MGACTSAGVGGALVIRGQPGIAKTGFVRLAVAHCAEMTVLSNARSSPEPVRTGGCRAGWVEATNVPYEDYDDIIRKAALAAAATGPLAMSPIPGTDTVAVAGIWTTMMVAIAKRTGRSLDADTGKRVVLAVIAQAGAYWTGSKMLTWIIAKVPGIGMVTGSGANSLLNGAFTVALGLAFIDLFEREDFAQLDQTTYVEFVKQATRRNAGIRGLGPVRAFFRRWLRVGVATTSMRLAILGQQGVGKSTLVARLMGEALPPPPLPAKTHDIEIGGRCYRVHRPRDLGGAEHDWAQWKEAVRDSGAVVYLISAKDLEEEEVAAKQGQPKPPTWDRLSADAEQLRLWNRRTPDKRVVLGITHRDIDPRSNRLEDYDGHLRGQLSDVINLLGGDQVVSLVSGSLAGDEDAMTFTHGIVMAGAEHHASA